MLTKKFYIPIGALIIAISAIAFFALRSDTPKEPIVIYKTVKPIKRSSTPATPTAEGRTFSASQSKEETAIVDKNTQVPPLPGASEDAEFSRAELLERFPQYDFHSPESKENLHAILRGEKILANLQARNAELERKIAVREAQKDLVSYLQVEMSRVNRDYPDFMLFVAKYPNPEIDDFIREYPEASEREVFMARVLEAGRIISEAADRILETPGMREELDSVFLSELERFSSLGEQIEVLLND